MGSLSIWHWLIVILVVVMLFGRNKISDLMGDVAKGVKSFKKGLADEDDAPPRPLESKTSVEVPSKVEPTKVSEPRGPLHGSRPRGRKLFRDVRYQLVAPDGRSGRGHRGHR